MTQQQYQKCIDACIECATVCNHCAISCLEERDVQYLTKCIRLDLECAVICRAAAELLSTGSRYSKEVCQLCATICNACAEICEKHAEMGMEHCSECAEACRACAKETMEMYQNLEKQSKETKETGQHFVHQDECAIISRAAAELVSFDSGYSKEFTQLNASICDAAANEFEKLASEGREHLSKCANTATTTHEGLLVQEQQTTEANQSTGEKDEEKVSLQAEGKKNKKKHSSALLAASMWRSPTGHSLPHVNRDVRGSSDLANTGPFVSYE